MGSIPLRAGAHSMQMPDPGEKEPGRQLTVSSTVTLCALVTLTDRVTFTSRETLSATVTFPRTSWGEAKRGALAHRPGVSEHHVCSIRRSRCLHR